MKRLLDSLRNERDPDYFLLQKRSFLPSFSSSSSSDEEHPIIEPDNHPVPQESDANVIPDEEMDINEIIPESSQPEPDESTNRCRKPCKTYTILEENWRKLHCCGKNCIVNLDFLDVTRERSEMQVKSERERMNYLVAYMSHCFNRSTLQFEYKYNGVSLCRQGAQRLFKVSNNKWSKAMTFSTEGRIPLHGNANALNITKKRELFDYWIEHQKENYCCVSPSGVSEFHFPTALRKQDLFEFYKAEFDYDDSITYGTRRFLSLVKENKIKLPKNSRLGHCNECIDIKKILKDINSDEFLLSSTRNRQAEHLDDVSSRKQLYYSDIRLAKAMPEKYKSLIMDFSQKIHFPWFIPIPKSLTMNHDYKSALTVGAIIDNGYTSLGLTS